ncbi:zinc metalloproteinase nas-13-like [Clytia hemisphaerica]|uniref:Metalloendopeptidase n=1 Tax=Clytia hemisphaerica TaxID=252671 RepID=A0A7M5XA72_9CNID
MKILDWKMLILLVFLYNIDCGFVAVPTKRSSASNMTSSSEHQNTIQDHLEQAYQKNTLTGGQNTTTTVNGAVQKKQWLGTSPDMMGGNQGMMMVPMQQAPIDMGMMNGGMMPMNNMMMDNTAAMQANNFGQMQQPMMVGNAPPQQTNHHTEAELTKEDSVDEAVNPPVNVSLSIMDQIMSVNIDPELDFPATLSTDDGDLVELFEGDIIRNKKLEVEVSDMKKPLNQLRLRGIIQSSRWPHAIVPYRFHGNFSEKGKQVVASAINIIESKTCVNFKPKNDKDKSFIEFVHGGGCASNVGRQGGKQKIVLGTPCLIVGIALHQLIHSLGFFHETSRRDRDKFVRIEYDEINKHMWYNFQRYRDPGRDESYDKFSIMHFGSYAFSLNGERTVISKSNAKEELGRRLDMSTGDIQKINNYYDCKKGDIGITSSKGVKINLKAAKGGNKGVNSKNDKADDDDDYKENNDGELKDKYSFCFKLGEFCDNEKWVKKHCLKTCCKDRYTFCKDWTKKQYCFKSENRSWMKANCPKSCEYC